MSGTPAGRTDGHSTPAGPEARGRRRDFSGVGLRPDCDHAAPGGRAAEFARNLRAAAVDLDALDVVRWRVAREVRRRFPAVEVVRRVPITWTVAPPIGARVSLAMTCPVTAAESPGVEAAWAARSGAALQSPI